MNIQYKTDDYVVDIDCDALESIWRSAGATSSKPMPLVSLDDENDDLTKDKEVVNPICHLGRDSWLSGNLKLRVEIT